MLRTRSLIPPLSIHLPNGHVAHAWDFKQKKNLVIAFLDAECGACENFLEQLAGRAGEMRAKDLIALIALLEAPAARIAEALPAEIIVGAEVSGRAARSFLGPEALSSSGLENRGVFVADRYGELFAQWIVKKHEFPSAGEILGCVDQAEMACDQCSAPAWPTDG